MEHEHEQLIEEHSEYISDAVKRALKELPKADVYVITLEVLKNEVSGLQKSERPVYRPGQFDVL